jgi:hypothetical protein
VKNNNITPLSKKSTIGAVQPQLKKVNAQAHIINKIPGPEQVDKTQQQSIYTHITSKPPYPNIEKKQERQN